MSEEKELIKKRSSYKGRLTSFLNYLNTISEKPLTSADARELQIRLGKIISLYEQYDEVQLRLECVVDNVESQYADRTAFESNYYALLARAQGLLDDFNRTNGAPDDNDATPISSNRKLVKLPTIQLPNFNGSYNKWLEFHDTFNSLINSNNDIDDINKFHYLRASLEGSAAFVIQSIEFSAKNYQLAWNLLCERFNNKRILIQNHVNALFNLETITKESSAILKRFIDEINKNLKALESLGEPVNQWDTLVIHIITHKLDHKTYYHWEEYKGNLKTDCSVKLDDFFVFMRNRADLIETLEMSRNNRSVTPQKLNTKFKAMVSLQNPNDHMDSSLKDCPKCKGDHTLINCSHFLALSNEDRLKLLPKYKVCFNCFKSSHFANHCKMSGCKICKRKHNTLIHVDGHRNDKNKCHENNNGNKNIMQQPSPSTTSTVTNKDVALSAINVSSSKSNYDILLSTALVKVHDNNNREYIVRAVLDCGSTACLMTDSLCQKLNIDTRRVDNSITGINNVTAHIQKQCYISISSLDNNYTFHLNCFLLPTITDSLPNRHINISNLHIPSNICLADPTFYKPTQVDLLIGADLFWDILGSQMTKLGTGKPVLCETKLGWIISGPVTVSRFTSNIRCNLAKFKATDIDDVNDLHSELARFWQLEEINTKVSYYSPEEKLCEEHFLNNTRRLEDGRFCVRIPLNQNPEVLGESYRRATQSFLSLERRLKTGSSEFSKLYYEFMSEYQSLGHMSECTVSDINKSAYFIPHHGVIRESSNTTKLRVVYNASCPTSSGISFNQIQMVGPSIQDDLLSILIRFRQHKYILSADIEKMYRQILVNPLDRHLQQILWRNDTCEPIKTYQLNTVTYGTASASFLAIRCLMQLGIESKNDKVAETIKHDFYVDDLLTGGDNADELKILFKELTDTLGSACMTLRKWKSNNAELIPKITEPTSVNIGSNESSRLLGLGWCSETDEIYFPISSLIPHGNTKRDILSVICRIFDPLGLLSPVIITMKMLMQNLWLHKLSWDDKLTPDIIKPWSIIIKDLPLLNRIRIPRIIICNLYKRLELHIFTDASERAYGACVYVRSSNIRDEVLIRLLTAKGRVAPIKSMTIPRLELCGALAGARLYEKVINSLRTKIDQVYFWTDSTIVLGWLQMLPSKLQPFVRNRITDIIEKTTGIRWRHVPTDKNPADLISRGIDINKLQDMDLWWSGPKFLEQHESKWPCQIKHVGNLPEIKSEIILNVVVTHPNDNGLINFNRFSNYLRLVRSIAYVLRFIKYSRKCITATKYLAEGDLKDALNVIISHCQDESFPEYKLLLIKKPLPKRSSLLKFNVFLDEKNVMRIGGRIDNSNFDYNKKHPILIQSTHIFTKLLFDFEHKRLMHAGPLLLLASIKETYWPIGGRNLAKTCYHKCVRCARFRARNVVPIMGNLPQQRLLSGSYPFENVGVDYAGPILSASRQGRGCKLLKVYIAIFICFTTKAIHLELVGDLTSNSYILALRRFTSRRGKPNNIYSDNGTSFVGACKEISKFLKTNCNSISECAANDSINFHFIPAYTPHFGGLWEAGVKSTKYHLQRVLGNCNLTYEDLNTVLVQIEAVLNSRPLTPLSSDPADYTPLTPGHFLIGRPLTSLPHQDYHYSKNILTRYQRIEQLRQQFWSRWSKEFIAELQQRTKWRTCKDTLELNTLVIVKENHLPPLKWKLGRIVAVHPGPDGVVRVADIKTSTGVIRRAFNNICPLPISTAEFG